VRRRLDHDGFGSATVVATLILAGMAFQMIAAHADLKKKDIFPAMISTGGRLQIATDI
jgi:hypothetical protein